MGNDNGASASGLRKITTNSSITDRHHVPSGPNMVDADLPSLKYIISNLSRHGDRHPEPNPSPANGDGQQQQRESSDGTDRSPITPLGREKSDGEAPAGLEEGDTPKASLPTEHTYPEGGVAAYTVVFGSFVSMIACFGIMNTIGSLQTHLHQNQLKSYSEGEVGWIFGLYAFLSFFGGIWIGPVFDRKGPQVLLAVGSVLLVASLVILGHCTAYWHFILDFGVGLRFPLQHLDIHNNNNANYSINNNVGVSWSWNIPHLYSGSGIYRALVCS